MPATLTRISTWRRVLIIAIAALIAALAISFSAPNDAHAFRNPNVVLPSHQGWVYVQGMGTIATCPAIYPVPEYCKRSQGIVAWRWSGSAWSQASLAAGTRVYAYPYSGSWHWVWTQHTGWLATQTANLNTGYRCTSSPCPVF